MIADPSRGLSRSEKNYPAHKLELNHRHITITDTFHDYLNGNGFKIVTGNNPLTYILTTAELDATGHCWLAPLSLYNFHMQYCSGKQTSYADGLL